LALPQVYWLRMLWRAGGRTRRQPRWPTRIFVVTAILTITAVLYDRISIKFLPATISHLIAPVVQLWIFSSTLPFFLTKALHALAWCGAWLSERRTRPAEDRAGDASRRKMLRQTASVLGGVPFAAAVYGYSHERFDFAVESVDVPIANLPASLDGLRIVQL